MFSPEVAHWNSSTLLQVSLLEEAKEKRKKDLHVSWLSSTHREIGGVRWQIIFLSGLMLA
jgi:hypothetical protein